VEEKRGKGRITRIKKKYKKLCIGKKQEENERWEKRTREVKREGEWRR